MRLQQMTSTTSTTTTPTYLTVTQFTAKHSAFRVGGIRHWIFNENTNGLKESNSIIRIGSKLLLNEQLFFAWVQSKACV
jgi:hypothetical protein